MPVELGSCVIVTVILVVDPGVAAKVTVGVPRAALPTFTVTMLLVELA